MDSAPPETQDPTALVIQELQALRRYNGPLEAFWKRLLEAIAGLSMARAVLLLSKPEGSSWRPVTGWPPEGPTMGGLVASSESDHALIEAAHGSGHSVRGEQSGEPVPGGRLALRVEAGEGQPPAVLLLLVDDAPPEHLVQSAIFLRMVADVPAAYQRERALDQAAKDVVRFGESLEVMSLINEATRFMKAAITFCNELATRYDCSRVSLGWLVGDYIKVQTLSHVEKFDHKTSAVQALEACLQESFDQDEEILWPRPVEFGAVTLAHEEYSRKYSAGSLVSLPVRVEGRPVGVITCERAQQPFNESEVQSLRLLCDQGARRLSDLKRTDRWFGARAWTAIQEGLGWVFGVRHTMMKVTGLLIAAIAWYLAFGTLPFRIEGVFLLRTDLLTVIPAPYEGYIQKVEVQVGDAVEIGDLLLTLDTRELLHDESASLAEVSRHAREAEKAEAKRALSEMKIARAMEAQALARLDKIRFRLKNSEVRAPMKGLIVEGDLKNMLGSPMRRGDVLFRLARIEELYPEIDIDERDIDHVTAGSIGEAALVSRPTFAFPIQVVQVEPAATVKDGHNRFTVRGSFTGTPADWWRPGMSGIAKIDVGPRNVGWILTHRTIEQVKLWLWW